MWRFLHAADLHLDSPLRGLERYEGAPADEIRAATSRALERLVALAIEEKVSFVLIAGDVYDGDWRDYNTGLFFHRQMVELREAGIPVFVVSGNHDAASQISKHLKLPDNVEVFRTDAPEVKTLDDLGVAIHGQGFATQRVTADLSAAYGAPIHGFFNIGLLHTCAEGREGHERYAPCRIAQLALKGYEYWALGHVHRREVLAEEPWIVFPGNTQGRHVRETGPKGCTIVTVENGRIESVEHRDLDVFRWDVRDIDASGAREIDEIFERIEASVADGARSCAPLPVGMRLSVRGSTPVHSSIVSSPEDWRQKARARATDAGSGNVWVEKIEWRTRLPQTDFDDDIDEIVASLDLIANEVAGDEAALLQIGSSFDKVAAKIRRALDDGGDPLDLSDPEFLRGVVEDARVLLVSRLLGGESPEP